MTSHFVNTPLFLTNIDPGTRHTANTLQEAIMLDAKRGMLAKAYEAQFVCSVTDDYIRDAIIASFEALPLPESLTVTVRVKKRYGIFGSRTIKVPAQQKFVWNPKQAVFEVRSVIYTDIPTI